VGVAWGWRGPHHPTSGVGAEEVRVGRTGAHPLRPDAGGPCPKLAASPGRRVGCPPPPPRPRLTSTHPPTHTSTHSPTHAQFYSPAYLEQHGLTPAAHLRGGGRTDLSFVA
jgi:hypothetical protein